MQVENDSKADALSSRTNRGYPSLVVRSRPFGAPKGFGGSVKANAPASGPVKMS